MDAQTYIQKREGRTSGLPLFSDAIFYPESHADDMGESNFHYQTLSYLFHALKVYLSDGKECAIAANMNLYYEEGNPQNYYTPDLMIAFGAERRARKVYKLWEEKIFPQVIFEIASQRTWKNDIGEKSEFYAAFGTEEYYLIDAERTYLPLPLMAYRREEGRLKYIPLEENRIFSPLLNLEIVDTGKSFRLFDPAEQKFLQAVLTGEE